MYCYNNDVTPFENLTLALRSRGFSVEINSEAWNHHIQWSFVKGFNIVALFGEPGAHSGYIDNRIAADHEDCYNKLNTCPLVIELPTNQEELNELFSHLALLGSREGYNMSNTYDYQEINPFPYHMDLKK